MKQLTIDDKCIGCRACVRLAPELIEMNGKKAVVVAQPRDEKEESKAEAAAGICPVQAIELTQAEEAEVILSSSKVRDTLERYPKLKDVLWALSPKFKTMQNPVMWNTIGRFATFRDAARMSGVSVCEILHTLNKEIGMEQELFSRAPECIQHDFRPVEEQYDSVPLTWEENGTMFDIDGKENEALPAVIEAVSTLKEGGNLVVYSGFVLDSLIAVLKDRRTVFHIEQIHPRRFKLSLYKQPSSAGDWRDNLDRFDRLDVRSMQEDPFDVILKKAYDTQPGDGFVIVQKFRPDPLINMLSEMGFEHHIVEKEGDFIFNEVHTYFYKTPRNDSESKDVASDKPSLTIQSATPVAYPVIMRLLQSKRLRDAVHIKELKVWRETEKHLAWVVDGRADVTFSAVITASKLKQNDVIMPAVFVWDNFFVITRGYKASSFEELKGRKIYTPLFEDAPPTKITKYLIEAQGLSADDFSFVYGKPFGRPEEILASLAKGEADTAILREPEASFAINAIKARGDDYSVISFGDVWNQVNKDFGLFPNAGILFKGSLVREYPDIARLFLEELESAIKWVTEYKKEAAQLSFDMMRQTPENVELFLDRVTFSYLTGDELLTKIEDYYRLLIDSGIVQTEWDDDLRTMFSSF